MHNGITNTLGGLHKISSILIYSSNDLCRMLNLSAQDVDMLVSAASNVVVPSAAVTVLDMYMREVRLRHWGWLNMSCMSSQSSYKRKSCLAMPDKVELH